MLTKNIVDCLEEIQFMKSTFVKFLLISLIMTLASTHCYAVHKNHDDLIILLEKIFNHDIIFLDRNLSQNQLPKPFDYLLTQPIMTLSLEKHYHFKIKIKKITSKLNHNIYTRAVIMYLDSPAHETVEFALIKINLSALPKKMINEIMFSDTPFGKLLALNHIDTSSKVKAYFSIKCNPSIQKYTHCILNQKIYGRTNIIVDQDNKWLAKVVEVLPGELSHQKTIN